MKYAALVTGFALSLASLTATAAPFNSDADRDNYYTVTSIEMHEVTATNAASLNATRVMKRLPMYDAKNGSIGAAIGSVLADPNGIQGWVTLGEKIWDIIVKNKPVVNVSTSRVSVLPSEQQNWLTMERWQGPVAKTYVIEAKNAYGMSCVKHTYTVAFNYGGTYQGKGQYIANATIIPSEVNVIWGYTLNSKVEVAQTVNMGTAANPLPGIEMQVQWAIDTVLKHAEQRTSYFVRGDGQVLTVN